MADHLGDTHAVAFGRIAFISTQHVSSFHVCCLFFWTHAQDRGSEHHLIQICIVSNDFMVSLLNGLQVCDNGICQSALELAPSHIFDLLGNDILQHCTQPLYARQCWSAVTASGMTQTHLEQSAMNVSWPHDDITQCTIAHPRPLGSTCSVEAQHNSDVEANQRISGHADVWASDKRQEGKAAKHIVRQN